VYRDTDKEVLASASSVKLDRCLSCLVCLFCWKKDFLQKLYLFRSSSNKTCKVK